MSAAVPLVDTTIPALARVERTGQALLLAVLLRATMASAGVLVAALAMLAAFDVALGLPILIRLLALPLALVAAVAVGLRGWRDGRGARSREQVALWIEERVPALRYALATLADARLQRSAATLELERIVGEVSWTHAVRRAAAGALLAPGALLILSAAVLAALPGASVVRVMRPRPGDVLDAALPLRGRRSVLAPLVATVTPPAYTGRNAVTIEEPVSVAGIAGSEVAFEGRGSASRVRAQLGTDTILARTDGTRWQVRLRMPARALALRLADGTVERLVTIEPYPDSAPVVTLRTPARDSVFRNATGTIPLAADASDDLGLAETRFEYIISSGEMESFTFRTGALQPRVLHGERRAELEASLVLGALSLSPGDVIHIRAVAGDANTVTGPGRGASETRTIRIARRGEYDSVAVEALPSILGDTAALSQRMLIMLAEALERRRPHLARDTVVGASRDIAVDQARLRRRVADIVFMRVGGESSGEESEGDNDANRPTTPEQVLAAAESAASRNLGVPLDFAADESPVIAVNRPLLDAYNAMWEAGRWLEIGEPDDALPHMRAALAAIQRARQAERIYLRGRPPTQVVDLRDARLKGDRALAAASLRFPTAALGAERARLMARLAAAAGLARAAPADASDSLLLVRLDALGLYPAFAGAVGRAAATLRRGADATADILRARDALLGAPRHAGTLPDWGAAP